VNRDLSKRYSKEKDEHISVLLKSSLRYALEANGFNEENYFVEDVTVVIADYEMLVLKIVNELVQASLAVVQEFSEQYSK